METEPARTTTLTGGLPAESSPVSPQTSGQPSPKVEEPSPFLIPLPRPFSDADTLQFLARSYEAGRPETSDISMAKALLQTPAAQAAAQWLRLRNGAQLPFQSYADFQATYPDWPTATALRRKAEIALITGPASDDTKKVYFTRSPPETSTGKIFWARVLLTDGKLKEALDIMRPIWRQERLLPGTEEQIRNEFSKLLTQDDYRARMISLMAGKNWDAALRAAKSAGSGAEAIVKARMAAIQNSKTAQTLIDAVPKENQADPIIVHSRLLLLNRQKKYKEAAELIQKLVKSSGTSKPLQLSGIECKDWQTQQRFTIRELMDAGAFDEAYEAASARISRLGCTHNDAEFLAGWIAFRFLGQPENARKHFDVLAADAVTASQKARAAYWQGRLAEFQHDKGQATAAYERAAGEWNTFYGQLAAEKLPTASFSKHPATTGDDMRPTLDAMTAVQALKLLGDGGADDLAYNLYIDLANSLPDKPQLEALSSLAAEQQNARAALAIAKIARRRGIDLGSLVYPTFGMPDIRHKVKEIEPPLLYAIAHQESAFNPKARSHAGAQGLMQLMPDTARTTANRSGIPFNVDLLTADPTYNTTLGAAHLKDLLADWKGSLILSFAAYNAGGGNVKKWIAAHGDPRSPDVDVIDWIERIPFYETRHYVQRITENLMIYRRLMNSPEPSLFAREINTVSNLPPLPAKETR